MMQFLPLVVSLSLHALVTAAQFAFHPEWQAWKDEHKKSYTSTSDEYLRHNVWLENKRYIENHNQNSDVHGFTLKMNHLGDLVGTF